LEINTRIHNYSKKPYNYKTNGDVFDFIFQSLPALSGKNAIEFRENGEYFHVPNP
tara:strand:- start:468 stop:632 length:165 start_codon:yes stop_codon:yes gene_type:complete